MAYGVVHFFPGGTKAQYEAAVGAAHPGKNALPKGQQFHFAGPTDGGWVVIATFDKKASWETFRDGILIPSLQKGVAGAFAGPPEERTFEIDTQVTP
ncbi:hypothetical protein K8I85_09930 [bacterium]|nr:hypothetical protein [bacterium]